MLRQRWMTIVAVLGLSVLTGCAGVQKQAFNRDAAKHIKTVTVAQQADEDSYGIAILAHPGMSFGLIGGLVAAAEMASKGSQLTTAIDPQKTKLRERLTQRVSQALQAKGYTVTTLQLSKDLDDGEKAKEFVKQNAKTDAAILLRTSGGYTAASHASDYQPHVFVVAEKIELSTGKTLYRDLITYGYSSRGSDAVHLSAPDDAKAGSMDSLLANPDKTRQMLHAGVDAAAQQIISDLAPQ